MMKKILILLLANFMVSTAVDAQNESKIEIYGDKSQSTITYYMSHPLHTWSGESKDVTSVIKTNESRDSIFEVAVIVKIESFESKNTNRDSNMIVVTEALIYPAISFMSNSITQTGNDLEVTGTLKFHGISQEISFNATKKKSGKKLEVEGNFSAKMTDFNITPPAFMGMNSDDNIKLEFDIVYL
jgi:polyisoprenoid-binding protein YceI